MLGAAFTAAILLAIGVILFRRWSKRQRQRLLLRQSGRTPQQPLCIRRFDEIDAEVRRARCPCGGPVLYLSEGSLTTGDRSVRVVHCECAECEQGVDLFFQQDQVLH